MSNRPELIAIAIVGTNSVVGDGTTQPWHLKPDLKRFRQLTSGHSVIMGRPTFESIGKPLPNRRNIVVTRTPDRVRSLDPEQVVAWAANPQQAVQLAGDGPIYVLGGGEIWRELWDQIDTLEITLVEEAPEGSVTFPEIDPQVWEVDYRKEFPAEGADPAYTFLTLRRRSVVNQH